MFEIKTKGLRGATVKHRIQQDLDQAGELTEDNLQFLESVLESEYGQQVPELQPVLDSLASRYGATLDVRCDNELPTIAVDRLRVQHVLLTLVQNAFEAPRAAGKANDVCIEVTSDRYTVRTSVTDSGIGIPEQHKPQIFRPFFTTKGEGTGLGLASSRAIIESHEGTIGFEDVAGGGTRFWFCLPALSGGESP